LVSSRHKPQVCSHGSALFEAVGILQGEHEGQSRQRPDPLDLVQEFRFRVVLFADRF